MKPQTACDLWSGPGGALAESDRAHEGLHEGEMVATLDHFGASRSCEVSSCRVMRRDTFFYTNPLLAPLEAAVYDGAC